MQRMSPSKRATFFHPSEVMVSQSETAQPTHVCSAALSSMSDKGVYSCMDMTTIRTRTQMGLFLAIIHSPHTLKWHTMSSQTLVRILSTWLVWGYALRATVTFTIIASLVRRATACRRIPSSLGSRAAQQTTRDSICLSLTLSPTRVRRRQTAAQSKCWGVGTLTKTGHRPDGTPRTLCAGTT